MKFTPLEIPDIILIEPKAFSDDRGSFFESYQKPLFEAQGITEDFIQDNHVFSKAGVFRGLHYQMAPYSQAKLVRVIRGAIYDVAVDIRKASPTFGKHIGVRLKAETKQILYVPVGFAHGYLALEDNTEVLYKVSNVYSPESERGIIWSDPALQIEWPKLKSPFLFSAKDQEYPKLEEAVLFP